MQDGRQEEALARALRHRNFFLRAIVNGQFQQAKACVQEECRVLDWIRRRDQVTPLHLLCEVVEEGVAGEEAAVKLAELMIGYRSELGTAIDAYGRTALHRCLGVEIRRRPPSTKLALVLIQAYPEAVKIAQEQSMYTPLQETRRSKDYVEPFVVARVFPPASRDSSCIPQGGHLVASAHSSLWYCRFHRYVTTNSSCVLQ